MLILPLRPEHCDSLLSRFSVKHAILGALSHASLGTSVKRHIILPIAVIASLEREWPELERAVTDLFADSVQQGMRLWTMLLLEPHEQDYAVEDCIATTVALGSLADTALQLTQQGKHLAVPGTAHSVAELWLEAATSQADDPRIALGCITSLRQVVQARFPADGFDSPFDQLLPRASAVGLPCLARSQQAATSAAVREAAQDFLHFACERGTRGLVAWCRAHPASTAVAFMDEEWHAGDMIRDGDFDQDPPALPTLAKVLLAVAALLQAAPEGLPAALHEAAAPARVLCCVSWAMQVASLPWACLHQASPALPLPSRDTWGAPEDYEPGAGVDMDMVLGRVVEADALEDLLEGAGPAVPLPGTPENLLVLCAACSALLEGLTNLAPEDAQPALAAAILDEARDAANIVLALCMILSAQAEVLLGQGTEELRPHVAVRMRVIAGLLSPFALGPTLSDNTLCTQPELECMWQGMYAAALHASEEVPSTQEDLDDLREAWAGTKWAARGSVVLLRAAKRRG
ncbi:unnamed protein product [Symbiodinium sp. KB8]|nr:unnamed protein product [Symbiodinium sp. KB8]